MQTILLSFVAFWVALLPVYLWGYGVTHMLSDTWNRARFFLGLFLGSIGVGLTYIFFVYQDRGILFEVWLFVGYFFILTCIILALTLLGSRFSRLFLQKIAIVHAVILLLVLWSIYLFRQGSGIISGITPAVMIFLLTPLLEEWAKHLWTVWLIGRDFRFSQKDIVSFTFFVVLGFVFAENLLYLVRGEFSLGVWIWRSFFTLIAHVFAALICAYYWWRALSYPLFSLRYILTFLLGFLLAGGVHMLYNYLIMSGNTIGIILYAVIGYVLVVVRKN